MFNLLKKWEDVLDSFRHGLIQVLSEALQIHPASTQLTDPGGFFKQDIISDPRLQSMREEEKSFIINFGFNY